MRGKGLHLCCSRLKRPPPPQNAPQQSQNTLHVPSDSLLCSSTAAIFKNFNSLYDPVSVSDSEALTGFGSGSTSQILTTIANEDDLAATDSEPDLSTVFASRRLIRPGSTGQSNSIVDKAGEGGRVGFGAVPKLSPDPYEDFKRSMEEMVAAMGLVEDDGGQQQQHRERRLQKQLSGAQRMRLQELLLCYLALNRKNAHKYIVGAFADVLRGLSATNVT